MSVFNQILIARFWVTFAFGAGNFLSFILFWLLIFLGFVFIF